MKRAVPISESSTVCSALKQVRKLAERIAKRIKKCRLIEYIRSIAQEKFHKG